MRLVVNRYRQVIVLDDSGESFVIKAGRNSAYYRTLYALYEEQDITHWLNCEKMIRLATFFLDRRINRKFGTNFRIERNESPGYSKRIVLVRVSSAAEPSLT